MVFGSLNAQLGIIWLLEQFLDVLHRLLPTYLLGGFIRLVFLLGFLRTQITYDHVLELGGALLLDVHAHLPLTEELVPLLVPLEPPNLLLHQEILGDEVAGYVLIIGIWLLLFLQLGRLL